MWGKPMSNVERLQRVIDALSEEWEDGGAIVANDHEENVAAQRAEDLLDVLKQREPTTDEQAEIDALYKAYGHWSQSSREVEA